MALLISKIGIITKAIGGIYFVEAPDGIFECSARGIFRKKDISPCCGDRVRIETVDNENYVISEIFDRKNYLIRPPLANLDQLIFVVSTCSPIPNFLLLDKFIAICEYKHIKPIIAITKIDMKGINEITDIYSSAGITVYSVNNITGEGCEKVLAQLTGKLSAFTGNSGVGKSTMLNNILPELKLNTNEISKKLGRGKHTTRHVELYKFADGGYVADTPGFSTLDTQRYDIILKEDLASCFTEFEDFTGKCRFQDCSHTKEKGCSVIEAVNNGLIKKSRHDSYVQMYEEAKQIKEWEIKK